MTLKSVPNIKGPGIEQPETIDIPMPSCVQIKTEEELQEFKSFIEKIMTTANQNALNNIADYVQKQNAAMLELVKKLGAT